MAVKKGDVYKVTTKQSGDAGRLHLRSSPNGKIINHIPKNAKVKIANAKKCTSSWLYITYSGKTGYAYKKYLTKIEDTKENKENKGKKTAKSFILADGKGNQPKKPTKKGTTPKLKALKTKGLDNSTGNALNIPYGKIMKTSGLYSREQLVNGRFSKYFRYGHIDPYYNINNTREYIFFTKPNLNIQNANLTKLNAQAAKYPFFQEMFNRYKRVLNQLQIKEGTFNNSLCPLLSYHVSGSVDLPSVSAKVIEGPQTIYGIGVDYRGDGRQSDFNYDFSIQFTDDKLLTCYRYFKAWEEYERLKKKGLINPPSKGGDKNFYQTNKILHDQIGIYKFIVGEDGRELLYYAYYCGCFPKSLPRDSFNELKENPTYSIDWQCFKVIDMDPRILYNFNNICGLGASKGAKALSPNNDLKKLGLYGSGDNNHIGRRTIDYAGQADMQPVDFPFIHRVKDPNHISGYTYQLLWYVKDPAKTYGVPRELKKLTALKQSELKTRL